MIYNELDFFIFKKIISEKNISTWKIAESWQWKDKPFTFQNKKERERFYIHKTDYIGKRLIRMSKEGLIKITKDKNRGKKNVYNLIRKNVIFKKRHKFPDKWGRVLFIKEKDKKWQIFQL